MHGHSFLGIQKTCTKPQSLHVVLIIFITCIGIWTPSSWPNVSFNYHWHLHFTELQDMASKICQLQMFATTFFMTHHDMSASISPCQRNQLCIIDLPTTFLTAEVFFMLFKPFWLHIQLTNEGNWQGSTSLNHRQFTPHHHPIHGAPTSLKQIMACMLIKQKSNDFLNLDAITFPGHKLSLRSIIRS